MTEAELIALLRTLPLHPGARGLQDDAAVIPLGDRTLVLTHDMIVAGVHVLADADPADIAWRLVATNLSDLAAKGARPLGVLTGLMLGEGGWTSAFVAGLDAALRAFDCPLLGGDTVSTPAGSAVTLGLTAIGWADGPVPDRRGARAGDALFVTGTIGDAGLGLAIARGELTGDATLLAAYLRPQPLIAAGVRLAPHVQAMMDVSDGLLIDTARMAAASGLAARIDLDAVPLSDAARRAGGDDRAARLAAAVAGDDYQLLFAAPVLPDIGVAATRVGTFVAGSGLSIVDHAGAVPLPDRLGWMHG